MTKMRKIFLSAVMIPAMTVAMTIVSQLSIMASDAGSNAEAAMSTGKSIIDDGDYVYFGKTSTSVDNTYSFNDNAADKPIKWRVLDADATNAGAASGMFLVSENLFGDGTTPHGGVLFGSSNTWSGSTAQTWCTNFYTNDLSSKEQSAVLSVSKTEDHSNGCYKLVTGNSDETKIGPCSLKNEKVFFLSVHEATTYFSNNAARAANFGSSGGQWRLRSPDANGSYVGVVDATGYVFRNVYDYGLTARPAFNLNSGSVLFTSAAVGGKSSSIGAMQKIGAAVNREYKVTLSDSTRTVTLSAPTANGNILSVPYTGATTGDNSFISAVIKNSSGEVTYYGRLADLSVSSAASGTVSIDFSSVEMNNGDKLYLFDEQCNGDYNTDYASELHEISVPETFLSKSVQFVPAKEKTTTEEGNIEYWYDPVSGKYFVEVTANYVKQTPGSNTYSITYDLDGGTQETGAVTTYTSGQTTSLPTPTKEGCYFRGWKDTKNDNIYTSIPVDTVGNLSLIAMWQEVPTYTVTVEGGTVNGSTTANVTPGSRVTIKADNPNTFEYWTTPEGSVISRNAEYTFKVASPITLVAVLKAEYVIEWKSDYGIIVQRDTFVSTDSISYTEPEGSTKTGYVFKGWVVSGQTWTSEYDLATAIQTAFETSKTITVVPFYKVCNI